MSLSQVTINDNLKSYPTKEQATEELERLFGGVLKDIKYLLVVNASGSIQPVLFTVAIQRMDTLDKLEGFQVINL